MTDGQLVVPGLTATLESPPYSYLYGKIYKQRNKGETSTKVTGFVNTAKNEYASIHEEKNIETF